MKAIIKEYTPYKKKILLSTVDKPSFINTKVKVVFENRLGWVIRFGFFSWLTPQELRAIANKLDKYNQSKR